VGSVPTAVRGGVDGVLTPPGDAAALATAIADLISAPERGRALAAAARASVAAHFSLDSMVEGTLAVYTAAHARTTSAGAGR
jgi:glycosyltransferase involved in cell wall biosynthesis